MHDHNEPARLPAEPLTLPARGWQINPAKAVGVAALCWAGFGLITWLVLHGHSAGLDRAGLLLWRNGSDLGNIGSTALLEAVRDMTALGGTLIMIAVMVGAIIALLFLKLRREAFLLALTAISGNIAATQMKLLFARARPETVPHLTQAEGMSFPSGHSFHSALIYIAIALAFATMSARGSVRVTIIGLALAVSLLIAASRVWLGVHYPSDVAAGWLAGAGWAFLSAALFSKPANALAKSEAMHIHAPDPMGPTQ